MEKHIRITCTTPLTIPWADLHEIQGELKTMPADRFNSLRQSFIDHGLKFPCFVWKELVNVPNEAGEDRTVHKWWLIDGHGRKRVQLSLVQDGYTVDDAPCVEVEAESYAAAKQLVLTASSKYNQITDDGLRGFLAELNVPLDTLDKFHFDEIDMPKFKVSLQDAMLEAGLTDEQKTDGGEPARETDKTMLPTEDEYKNAAIKQVVLYFPADIYPEVLQKLDAVMQARGKQDYSQTVVTLLDEALSTSVS